MRSVYSFTLKSLFRDLKTYVFLAVMLLAEGAFLTYVNFNNQYSAMEYSLEFIEIALMLMLPLITAELFAADRESGFEKTLLAFGIPCQNLLLGKLLAALTVFAVPSLPLLFVPFIFNIFGTVNFAASLASVFSYILLGVSFVALCVFVSLTAKKRLYSYIISYTVLLGIYLLGILAEIVPYTGKFSLLLLTALLICVSAAIYFFTRSAILFGGFFCVSEALLILFYFVIPKHFAGAASKLFDLLSPCSSLNKIIYGAFDVTAIVHLLLFSAVFMLLSLMQLKRRKYE